MGNEQDRLPDLFPMPTVTEFPRRCAKMHCSGCLPIEHQNAGLCSPDPLAETGNIKVVIAEIGVATAGMLGKIRESDAILGQQPKFPGGQQPRRQAGLGQNTPEPVARMRIVCSGPRGLTGGCGTADHQIKTATEKVGKDDGGQWQTPLQLHGTAGYWGVGDGRSDSGCIATNSLK